jgi:hypothetical protein
MPEHGAAERTPNALVREKSPYLLQHAYNPVDWRAWNDESFRAAHDNDKPIFLSIGYATCHWCHVMERESFLDDDVARFLNEHFISIKVDREERPDVDAIYMDVCQALTGQGGWPMTIFMDAEKRPFFAGTYFPRDTHGQRLGFLELLQRIYQAWLHDRERVIESAAEITRSLQQAPAPLHAVPTEAWDVVSDHHVRMFDPVHGGFGAQPKFPSPHHLLLLLRLHTQREDTTLLDMVTTTLDAMRAGGIYDHVGFGLHRYATDREWFLPHFEKMLYDQAMLIMACTEAWQVTHDPLYATIVEEVAAYVARELTHRDGAFLCAQDADTDHEEGATYTWSMDELRALLGDDADHAIASWNATPQGTMRDEATGARTGTNVLFVRRDALRTVIADPRLASCRERLLAARMLRPQPLTDDKILMDWNGLMIMGLARAARAFANTSLLALAERAYAHVVACCRGEHHWYHRYRDGEAAVAAMLDDHAAMGCAAVELYQATGDAAYLADARAHAQRIATDFATEHGGFYSTSAQTADELIARRQETYDGAYPCGNSLAAWLFASLGALMQDIAFTTAARSCVESVAHALPRMAPGHCMLLCAWFMLEHGVDQVTVRGPSGHAMVEWVRRELGQRFLPRMVVLLEEAHEFSVIVCRDTVCGLPMTTEHELRAWLDEVRA